jgi:hypothetical protein
LGNNKKRSLKADFICPKKYFNIRVETMKCGIYKVKVKDTYVVVETGADVTLKDVDADIELTPHKTNHDITSRPGLIGANPNDTIKDIEERSYPVQGAEI